MLLVYCMYRYPEYEIKYIIIIIIIIIDWFSGLPMMQHRECNIEDLIV